MHLTLATVLLVSSILSQLYQYRRMREMENRLTSVEPMTSTSYEHVTRFDAYVREMWNSRVRLREVMHPGQQWQFPEGTHPEPSTRGT